MKAIVAEFPQQARTWAETEYLSRWAEAFEAGRTEDGARRYAASGA